MNHRYRIDGRLEKKEKIRTFWRGALIFPRRDQQLKPSRYRQAPAARRLSPFIRAD